MKPLLGLQLWSVRDRMEHDVPGTLKKVAELGFDGVEFAGFYDIPANEMKAMLDTYGLQVAASHTGADLLANDLDQVIAYNSIIGNRRIVCPWYGVQDKESLQTLINTLSAALPALKTAGMQLYYHNHNHEFIMIDGKYALDLLYDSFAVEDLKAEIDTYWVSHAGVDPVEFCRRYQGRCELIHLKDGTKNNPRVIDKGPLDIMEPQDNKAVSRPIGEGNIDVQAVINVAKEIDVAWIILEDETYDPDGMTCVTTGLKNVKTKYTY